MHYMRRRDAHKQFARTSLKHNVKNSEAFTIASLSKNNIKLGPSSQKYRKSLHVFAATSKQAGRRRPLSVRMLSTFTGNSFLSTGGRCRRPNVTCQRSLIILIKLYSLNSGKEKQRKARESMVLFH